MPRRITIPAFPGTGCGLGFVVISAPRATGLRAGMERRMRDGMGEGRRGKSVDRSRRTRARITRAAMSEPLERRVMMDAAHDHGAAMLPYLPTQQDLHSVGGFLSGPSKAA